MLFADSHTLKALNADGDSVLALPHLRVGLTKIGSGEAFDQAPPPVWSGVEFVTVGNPPKPKA